MGIYDLKYNKVAEWWTPFPLRSTFLLKFIGVLLTPISQLHQLFLQYRKAVLYELSITPQVCYLEALLNDRYDYSLRRIYIGDPIDKSPMYLYTDAELKPVYFNVDGEPPLQFLYTDSEATEYADDFIVWVPVSLAFDAVEMRSLVNKFKMAGMKFKIQTF